jgi:MinD superfamily P-loop ATPase
LTEIVVISGKGGTGKTSVAASLAVFADRIEDKALRSGASIAGRIRYDPSVTRAQMRGRAVVEEESSAAADIRKLWSELTRLEPANRGDPRQL